MAFGEQDKKKKGKGKSKAAQSRGFGGLSSADVRAIIAEGGPGGVDPQTAVNTADIAAANTLIANLQAAAAAEEANDTAQEAQTDLEQTAQDAAIAANQAAQVASDAQSATDESDTDAEQAAQDIAIAAAAGSAASAAAQSATNATNISSLDAALIAEIATTDSEQSIQDGRLDALEAAGGSSLQPYILGSSSIIASTSGVINLVGGNFDENTVFTVTGPGTITVDSVTVNDPESADISITSDATAGVYQLEAANGSATQFGTHPITVTTSNIIIPGVDDPWANIANATVATGSVAKNTNTNSWDASATFGFIPNGSDGYVEWQFVGLTGNIMAGLNASPITGAGYTGIDYAIYMSGSAALNIYENGITKASSIAVSYPATFRVDVTAGVVTYIVNGVVVYTSFITPASDLYFDCSFFSGNGTILTDIFMEYS